MSILYSALQYQSSYQNDGFVSYKLVVPRMTSVSPVALFGFKSIPLFG
jgi:hypothetical protein